MNKIYIALEENYRTLACELGASEILGVYDTIDKALVSILKDIETNVNDYDYVIDNECDLKQFKIDKIGCVRLFYKTQDNWDYHCEYRIIESEVL